MVNLKVENAVTTNIDKSIDCKHDSSVAYLHIAGVRGDDYSCLIQFPVTVPSPHSVFTAWLAPRPIRSLI